jgi:hypothetical protein
MKDRNRKSSQHYNILRMLAITLLLFMFQYLKASETL